MRASVVGRGPWAAFVATSAMAIGCNTVLGIKDVGPAPTSAAGKSTKGAFAGQAGVGGDPERGMAPIGGAGGGDAGSDAVLADAGRGTGRGPKSDSGSDGSGGGEGPLKNGSSSGSAGASGAAGADAGGNAGAGGETDGSGAAACTQCMFGTDQSDCGPCPVGEPCDNPDGTACASGYCFNGFCEATACSEDIECASGRCTHSYQDLDHDGYGTDQVVGRCDDTIPDGFAALDGDCCDWDSALGPGAWEVHPGQRQWFLDASSCPGVEFDYDCSGNEERAPLEARCDVLCGVPQEAICGTFVTAVTSCESVLEPPGCKVLETGPKLQLCH